MIEVTLLGTGTGVPYARRVSSGYRVNVNGESLLFEMGAGVTRRLVEAGIDFRNANQLFISHRHPDHCSDLIPFLFSMSYSPEFKRAHPLTIYGPRGFKEVIDKIMEVFPWTAPKYFKVEVVEVHETEVEGKDWKIRSKPTVHGDVPAVTYRLEAEGKVIAYSGDSSYCDQLIENAKNADLMIAECSFPEDQSLKGVHMNAREVADAAKKAGAKRLVLTHLYPSCDTADVMEQVKKGFDGIVEKGEDLTTLVV